MGPLWVCGDTPAKAKAGLGLAEAAPGRAALRPNAAAALDRDMSAADAARALTLP